MEFKELVKNIMQSENLKSELVKLKSFEAVYGFFKGKGYEGSEEELREKLFGENSAADRISEEELEQIAGGASGRKAMAACASLMMLMGVAPTGNNYAASAKVPFISNIIEKIKEKRHEVKHIKPTKKKPAEEKSAEEKGKKEKDENYDAEKAEEELERFLEEDFHGQEKAKDQIRDFFTLYNNERKTGVNYLTESKLPSPKILIFDGPSGTGKLYMAEKLAKLMSDTDVEPYITTAQDVKRSARDQYMTLTDVFMYGYNSSSDENLFNYLKKNEGKVKVVVLDEWDKLYEKQNGQYPEKHPLDEIFRDILDGYLKDWYGNNVDLSGTIFICTTNETKASVQGKVKVSDSGELVEVKADEKGYPVVDENGDLVYERATTNGSKTVVPHDASLMSRLSGGFIYFD